MDKHKFDNACNAIIGIEREKSGIGTLSEKTLHAVLKLYFEPDTNNQEVKVGRYYADILNESGIIEIQTREFNKLRNKLEAFLEQSKVTVVYPLVKTKWLYWIDKETGETTKKRKSPKTGTVYEAFSELYKIKPFLVNKNLSLCIVLLDMDEYRYLDGWSENMKKGSSRCDRIPVNIVEEIYLNNAEDYSKLIPESLTMPFTTKDYAKATKLNLSRSQTALNVLKYLNSVKQTGKKGNLYLYEK